MRNARYLECGLDHRITEWVGIVLSALLMTAVLVMTLTGRPWEGHRLALLLGLVIGLIIGDLGSGALHWTFDTWFKPGQPAFERAVLIAREHHTDPRLILEYPFRDYVSFAAWPTIVLFGPIAITGLALDSGALRSGVLATSSVVLPAMFFGTHFHALGHHWSSIAPIRWLQWRGLVMSPRHHRLHHNGIHTSHYCTFVGFMNPVCDRLRCWRMLEYVVSSLTGAEARQDDHRRASDIARA